jgi:hypothetical protein
MKTVANMGDAYTFVSDSQDVRHIKEQTRRGKKYDSFFVSLDYTGADYAYIYGMYGIVPWLAKRVYRVK